MSYCILLTRSDQSGVMPLAFNVTTARRSVSIAICEVTFNVVIQCHAKTCFGELMRQFIVRLFLLTRETNVTLFLETCLYLE